MKEMQPYFLKKKTFVSRKSADPFFLDGKPYIYRRRINTIITLLGPFSQTLKSPDLVWESSWIFQNDFSPLLLWLCLNDGNLNTGRASTQDERVQLSSLCMNRSPIQRLEISGHLVLPVDPGRIWIILPYQITFRWSNTTLTLSYSLSFISTCFESQETSVIGDHISNIYTGICHKAQEVTVMSSHFRVSGS